MILGFCRRKLFEKFKCNKALRTNNNLFTPLSPEEDGIRKGKGGYRAVPLPCSLTQSYLQSMVTVPVGSNLQSKGCLSLRQSLLRQGDSALLPVAMFWFEGKQSSHMNVQN